MVKKYVWVLFLFMLISACSKQSEQVDSVQPIEVGVSFWDYTDMLIKLDAADVSLYVEIVEDWCILSVRDGISVSDHFYSVYCFDGSHTETDLDLEYHEIQMTSGDTFCFYYPDQVAWIEFNREIGRREVAKVTNNYHCSPMLQEKIGSMHPFFWNLNEGGDVCIRVNDQYEPEDGQYGYALYYNQQMMWKVCPPPQHCFNFSTEIEKVPLVNADGYIVAYTTSEYGHCTPDKAFFSPPQ